MAQATVMASNAETKDTGKCCEFGKGYHLEEEKCALRIVWDRQRELRQRMEEGTFFAAFKIRAFVVRALCSSTTMN